VSALLGSSAAAAPAPTGSRRTRYQTDADTSIMSDNLAGFWITLDPAVIYEINSQAAFSVVYEPLYHVSGSTKPEAFEPLLAEALPEVSADGLTDRTRSPPSIPTPR
jgi:ABC-type transport system substrate-binding protein